MRFIKALANNGITCKLIIVGCSATINEADEALVEQVGFLNKNIPEEYNRLQKLLQTCHALLLPSVAECYGCVYCEANAYGLPALGRETGGIPEIIKEGENGLMVRKMESPEDFAKRWADIWTCKEKYVEMGQQARNHFEQRLNYSVFVERLLSINLINRSA